MHVIDLPDWAVARGRAFNDITVLAPARTALVNIDMQNVFVAEGAPFENPHARDIIPTINTLSAAARAAGAPVIWTRTTTADNGLWATPRAMYDLSDPAIAAGVDALRLGAPGHRLHPDMTVAAGDVIVDKYRYGALSCPAGALDKALRVRGVETVVVTGALTNCCCETTARELNMAGYKVLVVSDATAATTDYEQNAALTNLRVIFADVQDTAAVLAMLGPAHSPAA